MTDINEIYEVGRKKIEEKGLLKWCEAGAGQRKTIEENKKALDELYIVFKVFHEKFTPSIETNVLGFNVKAPFAPASVAGLARVHPDGEKYLVEACSEAGVPVFLNDSIKTDIKDLVSISSVPVFWVLKPLSDLKKMEILIKKAEDAGVKAIGVNVDVLYGLQSGAKKVPLKEIAPLTQEYYQKIREMTSLSMFIKGILHPDDCEQIINNGYQGIVLSNHGGRVLDYTISPIRTLPRISKNFQKSNIEIMIDSGFRNAIDIYKAVALGAKMVLLGRPILYAIAAGGKEKLVELFEVLKEDLIRILGLVNSRDLRSLDPSTIINIIEE